MSIRRTLYNRPRVYSTVRIPSSTLRFRRRVATHPGFESRHRQRRPAMAPGQPSTSGSTSRIQAIVFTTLDGYVIYEAYYEQLNDVQKCEIRTSFDTISAGHQLTHGTELVGRFKNGRIAGLVCGSVVAYALGTGYCDELMLVTFLETVFEALVDVLDVEEVKGRPAMDGGLLMGQYEVLAHVVDGACVEGIVDEVGVAVSYTHLTLPTICSV